MTTPNAIHQRCFHHESREAVSRCPICRRYFCRECVTEHDDRVLCVECLKTIVAGKVAHRRVRTVLHALLPLTGILVAWLFFYMIGRTLLLIPSSVHDGTAWESK